MVNKNMPEKKCIVCEQESPRSCSACFKVAYCSVEHQKQHWNVHKNDCSSFQIREDPEFGKACFATRDIKAGTIILEEPPLVISTKEEEPACIACGLIFFSDNLGQKCGKCQWLVCSRKCAQVAVHADNECKLFASKGFELSKMPDKLRKDAHVMGLFFRLIRTLVLKKSSSDIYKKIVELNSEYRVPGYHAVDEWCLEFLKPILASLDLSVEDEELLRLFKIYHTNCHVATIPHEGSTCSISALYFKASRMNHSCIPNCSFDMCKPPGFQVRIRASVNIRKGEALTIACFGTAMVGATKRRQQMGLKIGFQCKCKRCLDPTELGTYSSAIACTSCRSKSQNIGYFLPEDPLNLSDDAVWKCNSCGNTKPASILLRPIEKVHDTIVSKLEKYIESENGKALIKICKNVEDKYSGKSLHPNHWLIQYCRKVVVDYYSLPENVFGVDSDTNAYIIKCGFHLLAIYDVVLPGCSLQRSLLQLRLDYALKFQGVFTCHFPIKAT